MSELTRKFRHILVLADVISTFSNNAYLRE
jgi:hypothetical protein